MKIFSLALVVPTLIATMALAVASNVGPQADVAAVTATVLRSDSRKHVREVHVAGDYALLTWYWVPAGNGFLVYKRVSGEEWKLIAKGGGEGNVGMPEHNAQTQMLQAGVASSITKQLCTGWPKGNTPCSDTD